MIYDCIIIGAGAAGLFCSSTMPEPLNGLILEKTERAGTKLLMSGNGQCNITHDGSVKDFVKCYGKNGSKIRSCLYKYNNISLMDFLESNGVQTVIREDGKVFPRSMNSRDILHLLLRKTGENGFSIRYDTPAERIARAPFGFTVYSGQNSFDSRTLVIAAGGCSYPSTGSDGSFFDVLKRDLGLDIIDLKPALSPIQVSGYPYGELAGISFQNASVCIQGSGRKIAESTGGLLFTHNDLSGPAILNISKYASFGDSLRINYLAPLRYEQVLERLKAATGGSSAKLANIAAAEFGLPKRFCQLMIQRCDNSLKKLAGALTDESFIISSVSGFNKAMCTSGGISLSHIRPASMQIVTDDGDDCESRLFAIGEAVDIDGITGGYNLQFAYSSARAAGAAVYDIVTG